MQQNLSQLDWTALIEAIRHSKDPKVRQEAQREAVLRVWDGPEQPADRVAPEVFEPDHG